MSLMLTASLHVYIVMFCALQIAKSHIVNPFMYKHVHVHENIPPAQLMKPETHPAHWVTFVFNI